MSWVRRTCLEIWIWKMFLVVQQNFSKPNALHLLVEVHASIEYPDGIRVIKPARKKIAT